MSKEIFNKCIWLQRLLACLLVLAMVPISMPAYAAGGATIDTVVSGAHSGGISVDGNGNLYYMSDVDANKNNSYINKRSSDGDVFRIAGGGTLAGGGMADGVTANQAFICNPWKTVLKEGDLYFSDTGSMRIRKISNGKVYNVIGDGPDWSDQDGDLTVLTRISNPRGLAFDASGSLYFAEYTANKVRVISAGHINTVAGANVSGMAEGGYSGDGGPATAAKLNYPSGIALDSSGNLYIADLGNHVIREVSASNHTQYGIDMQAGYIYTIAGGGAVSGDGISAIAVKLSYPRDVIVDGSGSLYISELHRIRKIDVNGTITTVTGSTTAGYAGDGGDASQALLNYPSGLALDANGNLLIADTQNERIRKVTLNNPPSSPAITTSSLPDGSVGTTYRAKLAASGGTGVYTGWSCSGLPAGLRLTVAGEILGTPGAAGTYSVSITVTDSDDNIGSKTFELKIGSASSGPLNSWDERSEPASMADIPIYDIAYDGNTFMGVGESEAIMASADGVSWTAEVDQTSGQAYQGVAYGEGAFVAVGRYNGSGIINTKAGSGAWTAQTPAGSGTLESVAYAGNSTFIAAGRNTILISNNLGATWSAAATLPSLGNGVTFAIHGVAEDGNGHVVAVGEASNGQSIIWYSTDRGNIWSATASRIEGTGLNCAAYGDKVFIAMGNDGVAYLSGDGGNTWEYSELPGAQDNMPPIIYKVAFGNNTFVAVGQCEEGQYNVISSSDNGVTWTGRVSNPDMDFQAIAYGNNSFVKAGYTAAGSIGKLYQSSPLTPLSITSASLADGTAGTAYRSTLTASGGIAPYTWNAAGLPAGLNINTVTGEVNGSPSTPGAFTVAVTVTDKSGKQSSRNLAITISPSGSSTSLPLNWNIRYSGTAGNINHISYGNNIFTATADNGTVVTSRDGGNTWTAVGEAEAIKPRTVIYDEGKGRFIAAGNGIMASTDGSAWSSVLSSPYNNTAFTINSILKASNILLATGPNSTIFESDNGGASWTKIFVPNPGSVYFDKFFYVGAEDRFVGLADGTIYTLSKNMGETLYSSVSCHSDAVNTPCFKSLSYMNGRYYTVKDIGDTDVIMTSDDLVRWTQENSPAISVNQMVYDGPDNAKTFVIAGSGGVLLTSLDGKIWTPQESGTPINSVAYCGGIFVAVGDQGTILASADGSNWSNCTSNTTRNLYSIGYGNGTFIVGGASQALLKPGSASDLTITTTGLPPGEAGKPYSPVTLEAAGGVPPYTWSADWLPEGLSIDSSTGAISGTPGVMGTSNVKVSVSDSQGHTAYKDLSLRILRPQERLVSIGSLTGGTITASPTSATSGTAINLTITPDAGMQLTPGTLKYNDGTTDHPISGKSFTMPAANVTVTAKFKALPPVPPTTYSVSIGSLTGGSITASPTTATAGTTINLTITTAAGMRLKAGTLKYNDGTTDQAIMGTSFTMPAANVTVTAEFEQIPAATLQSIAITKPAAKLTYLVGDTLDLTGLEVTGTYSDGSTKVETVSAANVTGFNSSAPAASQILTITIGGKITTYTVVIQVNKNRIAPLLNLTVAPGNAPGGTAKIKARTLGANNHLVVKVSAKRINRPKIGDAVPSDGGVINPYISGTDISGVDLKTNKYMAVYEADATNRVVKFKLVTLTSSTINLNALALNAAAAPGNNVGEMIITATAGMNNHLVVNVSAGRIRTPKMGDSAPATGKGVINPYTSGTVISGVNLKKNKYVGVYEVDNTNKVVGFKLITLTTNTVR